MDDYRFEALVELSASVEEISAAVVGWVGRWTAEEFIPGGRNDHPVVHGVSRRHRGGRCESRTVDITMRSSIRRMG